MNLETEIKEKLQAALSPEEIVLTNESHKHKGHAGAGAGSHWHLRIVSGAFSGLAPVARHKLVYKALAAEMQGPVHALVIVAFAPSEK